MGEKILTRFHVDDVLGVQSNIALTATQAHKLQHVLRAQIGDPIALFNIAQGEWVARVTDISKKSIMVQVEHQLRTPHAPHDLWLMFAVVKNDRLAMISEKSTELGVSDFYPVISDYTQVRKFNAERFSAQCEDAVEQSGRMDVPRVHDAQDLKKFLSQYPKNRVLFFADEAGDALLLPQAMDGVQHAGFLIGPEGGFSPTERKIIRSFDFVKPISLGDTILRSETACVAALSVWHMKEKI